MLQMFEVIMLAYLFLLLAVAVRFMSHPWMFTPVAASLLFFGARGSRRQLGLAEELMPKQKRKNGKKARVTA